jgi:hypothetical protein
LLLQYGDWKFEVDADATLERTQKYSFDHCQCSYCKNFYEVIDQAVPQLRPALEPFGINLEGPCELMPFEPTLMLACYRVDGQIVQWGHSALYVQGVPLIPEAGDESTFLLWVGEVRIPWNQEIPQEEVVSPANLPEFLERMKTIWTLRHGNEFLFS